jgi:hypothetical protein
MLPENRRYRGRGLYDNIERMGLQSFNNVPYITPRDNYTLNQGTALVDSSGSAGQYSHVYVESAATYNDQQLNEQFEIDRWEELLPIIPQEPRSQSLSP